MNKTGIRAPASLKCGDEHKNRHQPVSVNEFKAMFSGLFKKTWLKYPENNYHEIKLFQAGFPSRLICKTL